MAAQSDSPEPVSVFNTSFSMYRVSPLYLSSPLSSERLQVLSQRLRDTLIGDVVRGIHVTAVTDESLARAGALERVILRWAAATELLNVPLQEDDEESEMAGVQGLVLELHYENTHGEAILLPRLGKSSKPTSDGDVWMAGVEESESTREKFAELPLLLIRLPGPLKTVIIDFLQGIFDCRIVPLRLDVTTLVGIWEHWIRSTPIQGPTAKDFVLTLSFSIPHQPEEDKIDCGLTSLDVVVAADDLKKFVRRGKTLEQNSVESMAQRDIRGPFTTALAQYIHQNTALDIFHPAVSISKIACGGFVLSAGRCKVFAPSEIDSPLWARRVVEALVEKASP
ncbi:hypothetical protein HOO65_090101 [Ceratocystis lukuohia]|uniref:Siroheme synthase n=1 Tax=Ceratocystis lukuohia TaxID=2019550 RepID=A0ABR4M961_9PEZI